MTRSKRIYVLDTNVLMHDPTALFKFEEHDVFLPMQVMEELDNAKKGTSEASRNARQVSRFLNDLIESQGSGEDHHPASRWCCRTACSCAARAASGKLYFQTGNFDAGKRFGAVIPDNHILGADPGAEGEPTRTRRWCSCPRTSTCASRHRSPASPTRTTRTTARSTISACCSPAPPNCRRISGSATARRLRSWTEKGRTFYEIAAHARTTTGIPNQFLYLPGDDEAELKVARVDRRQGHAADRRRLPPQPARGVGHHSRATASRTSRSTR